MKARLAVAIAVCALTVGLWIYLRSSASTSARLQPTEPAGNAESVPLAAPAIAVSTPVAPVAIASVPALVRSAAEPGGEDSFVASMHAFEQSDPARALEMARQGQQRWPNGERAAEFARTEVKCLYQLGRPSEGRGAAEAMVNKYVGTQWALEVERETGAHPYVDH